MSILRTHFALAIIGALLLGGCAAKPFAPGAHLNLVSSAELPPPDDVRPGAPYRIGAFDRLAISVFGVPELTQEVQVDASGRIALSLVGSLQAAGRSAEQLSGDIAAQLRGRYVRDPKVAVNVAETVSQVVTVEGEVREPGLYPVIGSMTLMRAVASAKGLGEFARLEDVVVFRKVGGQDLAALYNLGAIRRGSYPDPAVYADDVVIVGNSPSRRLFRDLLAAAPLLTTPIIVAFQR